MNLLIEIPSEIKYHRSDTELIEEFIAYFNSDFSISGIASVNEEHVSPHMWLQKTSLSEVEIAKMDPNMHSHSFVYQQNFISWSALSSAWCPLQSGRWLSSLRIMKSSYFYNLYFSIS